MSNLSLPLLTQRLETILTPVLGKFANGQTAIALTNNYPTGTPKGIACFINPNPEQLSSQATTGNLKAIKECYVVTLVSYDKKKFTTQAMRIIQKEFSIFGISSKPATENSYEQCTIRIYNTGFV